MGKDQKSLDTSREIRQHLISKWGRIPKSVWKVDWSIKCIELYTKYSEQQKINEEKVGKDFALSGTGARHGQLSAFPQDILQFLVTFLTPEKLKEPGYFKNYLPTVIDPFAGHNSRGETVWRNNRNYVGWDISQDHNRMNQEVLELLRKENENSLMKREAKIEFVNGDSREIDYNEEFDFSITSPPFYDIEYYGDEAAQLGRSKTYNDFIYVLRNIFENVYRALKVNSYIAVETNDFRRKGVFHTYHADMIGILKYCGFEMHDMIICDYGQGFLESFLSDIEANKITSKQHSYFAIAKKMPKRLETREMVRERLIGEVNEKKNNGIIDTSNDKQLSLL
jgi:16S rRNA G966 N2-methylase RsmD